MRSKDPPPAFFAKCDSYMKWAWATRFEHFFVDSISVGLLIEWSSDADALKGLKALTEMGITVPSVYRPSLVNEARKKARLIAAVTVNKEQSSFGRLLNGIDAFVTRIELAAPAVVSAAAAADLLHTDQSTGEFQAVVLDDGCAFANERFRSIAGTRVLRLWNQEPSAPLPPVAVPPIPPVVSYGVEWRKGDLDRLYSHARGEQDVVYSAAGLHGLRRAASHGTHVMDLLAGPESPSRPGTWEIVFVQFPREAVEDPSGRWLHRFAVEGLLYAIDCIGKGTDKVVINISWGPQTEPHDGSSMLERLMEMLVQEQALLTPPRTLVFSLPAGNSFRSRAHAVVECPLGGEFTWVIPPDGETPSFLELWWPATMAIEKVRLRITPPTGAPISVAAGPNPSPDGTWFVTLDKVGPSVRALVVVHPTGGFASGVAAHGVWGLSIDPVASGVGGDIHIYVARADHNMGARRRAKASYLTDPALERSRFVAPAVRHAEATGSAIRRQGTMNGIATGPSTYVASGYSQQTFASAPYSSSGPTRGVRTQPNYSCMTDRSGSRPGVRASGVRSGTTVVLVGTSAAAPQLGRMIIKKEYIPFTPLPYDPRRAGDACLVADDRLLPKA